MKPIKPIKPTNRKMAIFSQQNRNGVMAKSLRWLFFSTLAVFVLLLVTVLVLWDADFYTLRDRIEHTKVALFGAWQGNNWCPPGRMSQNCEEINTFRDVFKDMDDFNFFKTLPIQGTDLKVETGIAFATSENVLNQTPTKHWCYIQFGQGGVNKKLDLGEQAGTDLPIYTAFQAIADQDLKEIGLNTDQLAGLAHSHCQFAFPDQSDHSKSSTGE